LEAANLGQVVSPPMLDVGLPLQYPVKKERETGLHGPVLWEVGPGD
jgi:hypothetical protein